MARLAKLRKKNGYWMTKAGDVLGISFEGDETRKTAAASGRRG